MPDKGCLWLGSAGTKHELNYISALVDQDKQALEGRIAAGDNALTQVQRQIQKMPKTTGLR